MFKQAIDVIYVSVGFIGIWFVSSSLTEHIVKLENNSISPIPARLPFAHLHLLEQVSKTCIFAYVYHASKKRRQ